MLTRSGKLFEENDYAVRYSYDASDRLQYYGEAAPNGDETLPMWRIKKIYWDGVSTTRRTKEKWAGGTNEFKWVWDDRADLTY